MCNNKSISGLFKSMLMSVLTLFLLCLLLPAAGCASPDDRVTIIFGPRFFELTQTTPERWAEELRELYPEREKEVKQSGDTVLLTPENKVARADWRGRISLRLYDINQEFSSVPGHCRIDMGKQYYEKLKFCLDTQACEPVDEELIREVKQWCLGDRVIYYGTPDAEISDIPVEIVDSHPVSLEYLLDCSDLEAADLEGIDHEAFLQYFGVHTDNIGEYQSDGFSKMMEHYRFVLEEERWAATAVDYSSIYQQAEGKLKKDDLDNIEVVMYSHASGDQYEAAIIDYSSGKVYSADDVVVDDRDVIGYTGEGDREWLRDVLQRSGITMWKNEYSGTSAGSTGSFQINFFFRLDDGRCFRYGADGVFGFKPSGMIDLYDALSGHCYTEY